MSHLQAKRKCVVGLCASILALGLFVGCANTKVPEGGDPTGIQGSSPPPRSAPGDGLPVDPAVKIGVLDNGLTFYLRRHRKPEQRAALRLVVNAGSVLETDSQRGLAHFVEHMAFNGTHGFAKQAIVDYLEKVGVQFGRHTNAYTSFDETVYMLEVPTDDAAVFDQALTILREFASEIAFDPIEVDKERGVVIEEWRQGRGAQMRVLDKQFPVLFQGSKYADRLPIGITQVLEKATAEDLRGFYQSWYRPDLMAVVAVGDFDQAQVESLVRKHFGSMKGPANAQPRAIPQVPDHPETLVSIVTDKEMPQTSVALVNKLATRPTRTEADYRRLVAESLYHHMMNARLGELTRKADPPFFFGASATQPFVRSKDVFIQMAVVKQDGIAGGLSALAREVARVDRHGFTESELFRARTEIMRQMESAVAEKDKIPSASLAAEMARNFLQDEFMPGIEREKALHEELLPTISLSELNKLADGWLGDQNRVILISGPDSAPVPSKDETLKILAAVAQEKVLPYEDSVRAGPLVTATLPPGQIVTEKTLDALGVTEWTLSNGVRVMLKPTDFKNDQVMFSGFSPGGTSLVPVKDLPSAENASEILGASGLGEFGPIELEKALTGKIAGASASVGELEESMGGSAAPADLETAMQLLYLSVTAPRKDDDVLAAWITQQRDALENRLRSPDAVFADELKRVLYSNHPRRQPPSLKDLERFNVDRALAIHKARFADVSDAVFTIVGNFDLDGIRPLVLKYLANLPSGLTGKSAGKAGRKKRGETWKDPGAYPISGPRRIEVKSGVEPQATVRISFAGHEKWTVRKDDIVDAMIDALSIRLREVVREDMGGSYGISMGGGLQWRPQERFHIQIGFTCAPDNVDKLIAAVFGEIEHIKTAGFDADVLTKVKQTLQRGHEVQLKDNGFWLRALQTAAQQGRDPAEVLTIAQRIEALTGDDLRDAVRLYFDKKKNVVAIRRPAGAATP